MVWLLFECWGKETLELQEDSFTEPDKTGVTM